MHAMHYQPALAALGVCLVCLWILLSPPFRRLMLDQPNARSLHQRPVPRSGGLAIAAGVAVGTAMSASVAQQGLAVTLAAAAVLAAVSLADDLFALPTLVRLAAHLAAAAAVLAFETGVTDPVLFLVLLLAVAWFTNLYNFMDGSDGLAGGMAVIGFGAYALAAHQSGYAALAGVSTVIACASAGFLLLNFPPARIFMGDAGSIPLGFLAGVLGVLGWHAGCWPMWFPMLAFAPFACDATLTLLKRLLRREPVWQAHRDHYYQRLVRMGFGHRGTAWIEYAAMTGCAATALLARRAEAGLQIGAVCAAALVLIVIAAWIDARWTRYLRDSESARA